MKKIYGIVGTQRSGSNYLCSVLRSVEELGDPRECFNPVHIRTEEELTRSSEDAAGFAAELIRDIPSDGVFGFKIHYLQFFQNFVQTDTRLEEAFPGLKIIYLRRVNVVRQAISLWKAELTQSWTANMDQKRSPFYDFSQIRTRYFDLKIQDILWREYLSDRKLEYLNVFYEDVINNNDKLFFQIFAFLGRSDLVSNIKAPQMKKQADQTTDAWETRFRQDYSEAADNEQVWETRRSHWQAEHLSADPNYGHSSEFLGRDLEKYHRTLGSVGKEWHSVKAVVAG